MDRASMRVLVVEDHAFQRRMMVRLLGELGLGSIAEAENGRAALAHIEASAERIDLVVTDLDMPEMDGIELIRHLAERRLAHAVIVASGLDAALLQSVEQMTRAYGLQVLGNVEKPMTRERLAQLMAHYRDDADAKPVTEEAVPGFTIDDVRRALNEDEFSVAYQPQIELASGRIAACEALARWSRDGSSVTVSPDAFVPMIEAAGLIEQLTGRVLERAAKQCADWQKQGLPIDMSINVSMLDLTDVSIADRYAERVRDAGADPRQITLEITETRVMAGEARALDVLGRLRLKGFGLAIDDFGTGFSSLQQLSQVPFTELKIDRGFIQSCDHDARRRSIVETSLDLARRLKLHSVAEGVESQAEWNLLKAGGCRRAQGWFIAKAMPPAEFEQWALGYAPPES